MVLLHGGSPKGAELIGAKWADARKVVQVAFKPDWNLHAKAAPFKRNDQLLDVLPIGVIVFRAAASATISPTKLANWASRCSTSAGAAGDAFRQYTPFRG